jgi:hypothetical protein
VSDELFNCREGQVWPVAEDVVARLGHADKTGGAGRELPGQSGASPAFMLMWSKPGPP